MKKSNLRKRIAYKTILLWILVISSFVMAALALYIATVSYTTQQTQAAYDADTHFDLLTENARQEVCINLDIKPCTQDNINKHTEKN